MYQAKALQWTDTISVAEFSRLRTAVDFQPLTSEQMEQMLQLASFVVCAVWEDTTVGVARVLTDYVTDAYLTDVIIHPDFQGKGIGKQMIDRVLEVLKEKAPSGVRFTCNLYANPGKEPIYERCGCERLPTEEFGTGMIIKLS